MRAVYISSDKKFSVELPVGIESQMISEIARAGDKETGGIILGKYSNRLDCAHIKSITGPPHDSKSGYTWFERGIRGLQKIIAWHWARKEYYLGEWHFHPFGSANPSGVDKTQMGKIANDKKYNCPEPVLVIIGGVPQKYQIRVFIFSRSCEMIELINE